LLGYPERAAEHSRQALSRAEKLGHPFSLGWALCDAAWLHQFGQDRERTRSTAARALALSTEKGFGGVGACARILFGWTLADPGQCEQALTTMRQGLEDLRAQGALSDRNSLMNLFAEVCLRAGELEEGLKAMAESQAFADAKGEDFWQPEVHRFKGELLLQHDPAAIQDAETCFRQALAVARRQQARSLELSAAMSLARLWQGQGKTQAAVEVLAPVYGAFTEGFDTPDLKAARALLEQLHSHPN
jgi:predicted ATPase